MEQSTPISIWADGCYDFTHFGHHNNFRQAKLLGGKGARLVIGTHSDEDIEFHKDAPPVFTLEERLICLQAIRWVDEVKGKVPYVTTVQILDENNCDFCTHGNDLTTTKNGQDTYQAIKDAKRYKEVERTQGVSTTNLIKRMLALKQGVEKTGNEVSESVSPYTGNKNQVFFSYGRIQELLCVRKPHPYEKVVYVAGSWDILHAGHCKFLKKASDPKTWGLSDGEGIYLIVGVHDDDAIQFLFERALTLAGIRYVNDLVLAAPRVISADLLDYYKVDFVACGMITSSSDEMDAYRIPKENGIFRQIDSGSTLTTQDIIQRVQARREEYEQRNKQKELKEKELTQGAGDK